MIISISGKSGEGKDEIAKIVQNLYPEDKWEIKRWADKVKEVASVILNIPREMFDDRRFKESELGHEWGNMSVRTFLQRLGTDAIRLGLHSSTWINALMAEYGEYKKFIIPDTRFENELRAVKLKKGITVRVTRKATIGEWFRLSGIKTPYKIVSEPISKAKFIHDIHDFEFPGKKEVLEKLCHPSETVLDNAPFDVFIHNIGTLTDLEREVESKLVPIIKRYEKDGYSDSQEKSAISDGQGF